MKKENMGIATSEDGYSCEATKINDDPPTFHCVVRRNGRKVAEYEIKGWVMNLNSLAKYAIKKYRGMKKYREERK